MTYYDIDGNPVSLHKLCQLEPAWAANNIARLEQLNAELLAALRLGGQMRNAQVVYFRKRNLDNLAEAKRLEHAFDVAAMKALVWKAEGGS